MWQLINKTPFVGDGFFVRALNGEEHWAVVLKATFHFDARGQLTPAPEQQPLQKSLNFYGEPGQSSLKYDVDLLPARPATDVVLLGHAVAPHDQPVTSLEVGLSVGSLQKRLQVFGDRVWKREGLKLVPSQPTAFTRMPLVWERAFGGSSSRDALRPVSSASGSRTGATVVPTDIKNPVGVGIYTREADAEGKPLPNLEDPRNLLRNWLISPPPTNLGPIAPTWPTRLRHAGTYDALWRKERMPLLPTDFDPRYYQCAPDDQQVPGYLKGGETVELRHLTPERTLQLTVPRLPLRFVTLFGHDHAEGDGRPHEAVIHTLLLEPDERRLVLLYYTQLPCHHTLYKLRRTQVWLEDPQALGTGPRPLNVPIEPLPGGGRR